MIDIKTVMFLEMRLKGKHDIGEGSDSEWGFIVINAGSATLRTVSKHRVLHACNTRCKHTVSIGSECIFNFFFFHSGMIVALILLVDPCSLDCFVHKNIPYHLVSSEFFTLHLYSIYRSLSSSTSEVLTR
jgi:hypothetical protein